MKSSFILAALALGLQAHARQIPAAEGELEARQRQGGGTVTLCEWTGHCIGDTCQSDPDCDLDYICTNRKCAPLGGAPATTARTTARTTVRPGPTTTTRRTTTIFVTAPRPTTTRGGVTPQPACEWEGHCLGATCKTENDCDGQLVCQANKCANLQSTLVTATRPGSGPVTSTRPGSGPITRTTTFVVPRPTGGGQTPSCGDNPLACIGVSCRTDADCGFDLIICKGGVCGL